MTPKYLSDEEKDFLRSSMNVGSSDSSPTAMALKLLAEVDDLKAERPGMRAAAYWASEVALPALENWMIFERETVAKDGPYAGDRIKNLIIDAEKAIASYPSGKQPAPNDSEYFRSNPDGTITILKAGEYELSGCAGGAPFYPEKDDSK